MKSRIDKYMLVKSEELVFITIDETAKLDISGYILPKEGLKAPINSNVLVKQIKNNVAQEAISIMSIIDAMLYMEGIDDKFIYNDEYDKFIDAFAEKTAFDVKQYLGYIANEKYNEGEITDALVYMRSFLRRDGSDITGLYQYSIMCQEMSLRYQKDEDTKAMNDFLLEALHNLEKIIELEERFSLAYYQLGFHYLNQKQFIKAKLTWERALDIGIDEELSIEIQDNLEKINFKVQYEEGYNLVFQGKGEEGLRKLLPLEEQNPDWWNLLFIISLAYKSLGEREEAKKYLEKILITRPTQVDTLVELSLYFAEEGKMDKAIEFLTKAHKLRKDDPDILCNLGMAYLHNGDYDEAKHYIERAYAINPQDEVTIACMNQL